MNTFINRYPNTINHPNIAGGFISSTQIQTEGLTAAVRSTLTRPVCSNGLNSWSPWASLDWPFSYCTFMWCYKTKYKYIYIYGIGATIRIRQESWCLLYARFFLTKEYPNICVASKCNQIFLEFFLEFFLNKYFNILIYSNIYKLKILKIQRMNVQIYLLP